MTGLARQRPVLVDSAATLALASALTAALFWPSYGSLSAPTGDGDALAHYATGFIGRPSTQFGYPFGMSAFPYFPNTDLTQRTVASVMQGFGGDRFLSVNLVWLTSFPLTAVAAWWVFRLAGSPRPIAIALACSYSLIPYHVLRGLDHLYLAAMWSVPLAVGLALLTGRGEIPALLGSAARLRRPALVAACLVVAWSGIYYAFFACLLLVTALVWLFTSGAPLRSIVRSAIPLAVVAGAVIAVLFGAALANSLNPPSSLVADRQPSESALYSGNLAFALTPSPLTDVPLVEQPASRFAAYVQPELEGYGYGQFGTVLSTMSAVVLVVGLGALARRKRQHPGNSKKAMPCLGLHVALLATCVLFFVPWSLNFTFALLITPEIRAWDRLLPTILLLLMTGAVSVLRMARPPSIARRALIALVILVVTVLDGVTPYAGVISSRLRDEDRRVGQATTYASRVNAAVPERCGVLQLPYVPFPEKAREIGRMMDYEHFLVALTNWEKQWSYGGVKYTSAARWAATLDDHLTQSAVASLVEGGFCGVHLDRIGYSKAHAQEVEASLKRLLGNPRARGMDGRWLFFVLPPEGPTGRDARRRATLTPGAEQFYYPPTDPPDSTPQGGLTESARQWPTR